MLQSLKSGAIEVVDVPAPIVRARHVQIATTRTLISAGTERMLLQFGKANLLEKALQQPDRVRQTFEKMRTDGVAATLEAVRAKLDQPIPLGYCSAGVVTAVGAEVSHVRPGDRVVSNAPHAAVAVVGRNLTAKIPDTVSEDAAAFTPLGAIALQGCRLARPMLGETFCVLGLGLVGLIAVQLLRAHGCSVIGADFSKERLALAAGWGAATIDLGLGQDPVASALSATGGQGVDGVLIAASTSSSDPISQAARMCRKRGRIVLVGVTGLKLSRADFYEKELNFQVSCSYGPGRYEPSYEERGEDYPLGYVRWTEQRNFEAVLREMAEGRLDVTPLISETVPIADAAEAYARLEAKKGGDLGLLLAYPGPAEGATFTHVPLARKMSHSPVAQKAVVALIGAGGFGGRVTAPGLKAAGARLKTIVSRNGVSAVIEGRKAGFEQGATDFDAVLEDPEIDTVVITTRHDTHARYTVQALAAGKNVFVEKPLALNLSEIDDIEAVLLEKAPTSPRLTVGFNRRFSPFAIRMRDALRTMAEPKCLVALINAGAIPSIHWTQDPTVGGGRVIGEACHFIDFFRFLVGAPIVSVRASAIGRPGRDGVQADKTTITLAFEDGSIGTVHYFANGPKALSKERYEAFVGGRFVRLDNFRKLDAIGWPGFRSLCGKQDKGHAAALAAFISSVRSGAAPPIPVDEGLEVSRWTIRAAQASV